MFKGLLKKQESLIAVDIGASAVKLIELDTADSTPRLVNIGISRLSGSDIFTNNAIAKTDKVSEQVSALLEANAIADKRVCTAVPGPSVFTKKIKMPKQDLDELGANIQFEAGNFIPHNIDAVKLDYHIIGESGKNQLDVLVVAVKNEIIDSFTDCLALAGLEVAVVDVDFFALQNMFELNYPELRPKTVALINVGARFSSINICRNGDSVFTGDISVGGRLLTDALAEGLGISAVEAEDLKLKGIAQAKERPGVTEIVDAHVDYVSSEFNRQLSFFWSASGSEEGIDQIMLTGGGSLIPNLTGELSEKTGIECSLLNPFKQIECGPGIDQTYLKEIAPLMGVCVGMGIREPGDRIIPDNV